MPQRPQPQAMMKTSPYPGSRPGAMMPQANPMGRLFGPPKPPVARETPMGSNSMSDVSDMYRRHRASMFGGR